MANLPKVRGKRSTILALSVLMMFSFFLAVLPTKASASWQYESYDAQVVSKHWGTVPESTIQTICQMMRNSGATHIAIAVPYDNPGEWQKWVRVARSAGLKIISRSHPNGWEGDNGVAAYQTPADYLGMVNQFLSNNLSYLQDGDVFAVCVEPENGKYWSTKYGGSWSGNREAVAEYNQFIRDGINQADTILANAGLAKGAVNTHLVSTNGWIANNLLEQATVDLMGTITVDHYVEFDDNGNRITNNLSSMQDEMSRDLDQLWQRWGKPIYIGEWGFPIDQEVADDYQKTVIDGMFKVFASKSYLAGVNYWNFMGNTARLLNDSSGIPTTLRPAADVTKSYFLQMVGSGTTPPSSTDGGSTTPPPAPLPAGTIATFEQGLDGFDHGTLVPGSNSSQAIRFANPANGSDGAKKNISSLTLGGYTYLEFDVNINGNTLLSGDASAIYFDQGGWKYVSLVKYAQNNQTGWQHIRIPLADFQLTGDTAAYLGYRFWNYNGGNYDIDNIKLTSGSSPTPAPDPTKGLPIATFETGKDGFNNGQIVAGYLSNGSLRLTNPKNGSVGSEKNLGGAKIGSYSSISLDIDLAGKKLMPGDASALYFEQGGWKWISLSKYAKSGVSGWQHLVIPLSDFQGLDKNAGIAMIGLRFWNNTSGNYDIDNIVLQ